MSIARDDFRRTLILAVKLPALVTAEGEAVFGEADRRLTIRYRADQPLRLGSLSLPVLVVDLSFDGFSGEERADLLSHFDMMYRRGGG